MFSNFRQRYQVVKDHSKIRKKHFWMVQRPKMKVFGHFLEFSLLDFDVTKCFLTFGNGTRLWKIIQKSQKCIFEWSKEQKNSFMASSWTSVCWIDLILHILMVLNVFWLLAMVPGHEGSFKNHKSAYLNDPMNQRRGFWPSSSLVALICLVTGSRRLRIQHSQRCERSQRYQKKTKTVNSEVKFFWLKLSMSLHDVTVLNVSWGQASYFRVVG